MAYTICKKCQKFFIQNGKIYCSDCDGELTVSHSKIKEYLGLNPNASILEIVNETGVELKDINIFLEKGGASYKKILQEKIFLSPREQEDLERQEKEKVKMENKFTPRRLRR